MSSPDAAAETGTSFAFRLMVNEDVPYAPKQPQTVRYHKQLKTRGIPSWAPSELYHLVPNYLIVVRVKLG